MADAILAQANSARVTNFDNTGHGFFSTLSISPDAPRLPDQSHLDGAHGTVQGVPNGMGFVVFLKEGRIRTIEGYGYGDPTLDLDFELIGFDLSPWSAA